MSYKTDHAYRQLLRRAGIHAVQHPNPAPGIVRQVGHGWLCDITPGVRGPWPWVCHRYGQPSVDGRGFRDLRNLL
jgi:hypothetical protein